MQALFYAQKLPLATSSANHFFSMQNSNMITHLRSLAIQLSLIWVCLAASAQDGPQLLRGTRQQTRPANHNDHTIGSRSRPAASQRIGIKGPTASANPNSRTQTCRRGNFIHRGRAKPLVAYNAGSRSAVALADRANRNRLRRDWTATADGIR